MKNNSILKVIPSEQEAIQQTSLPIEGAWQVDQVDQIESTKKSLISVGFGQSVNFNTTATGVSAKETTALSAGKQENPKLIIEKLYSNSIGSDYAPASASKRERALEKLKVQTVDLRSHEKSQLSEPFDLSAENSVQKSSTKHHLQAFSAKKAPVFVYHETKSTRKIRVDQKRVSSLQDSCSSNGKKPGSQRALDAAQPTSALTKATADGYCHFQDEVNTTDQDLRELRKHTDGDAGAEDHYFEEGSLRYGLFNNDFDDDDKHLVKGRGTQNLVQNINFFGQEGHDDPDDKDCELRSHKTSSPAEKEAIIIDAGNQSVISSRRAQADPETESRNSKTSRVTSLNDLTLSADADSQTSSENENRKLSKPRSQQESGMSSAAIAPTVMVPAKAQIKSSFSISENSVDLTRPDGGSKPQISLKLGINKKTPMKNKMSRLQMFQQKLLQSEDSIKIDTLQQKTQKLENKNAQSSISISLRSRASSRTLSKANPKASPHDRRMNSTTLCNQYTTGVDYSVQERGRLPRTPLSPPRQQQNGQQGKLLQRGSNPGGLGIITQGLRNQKEANGGQNLNSETIVTNGQGGLRCFSSLLRNDAVTTNQGDSGERKPETFNSPNLRSEGSRRSLRGLSAQQALQKSIKKLNKIKSTPVSSFDYNQSPSPSPDSNFELDEDLRTFEEKYKIIETVVLGEGCSSVVKECVRRVASPRPQVPGLNLGKKQSSQGSNKGQRSGGARALGPGKFGSSPLVFGKNLVVKEDGIRGSASPPKCLQQSGVLDGKSPEKLAGLRLKIVRCDQADAAQDQADPTKMEGTVSSFQSPPGKQPAGRAGADANKNPNAEKGRSHSFGGLPGGSFLRLHEIAIQKIHEVDEDKLPSTRRSQLEERFSSGNSKQIDVPEGKRKKSEAGSPSSSEGSSCFSEQQRSPSVTSDSPEAIEQQISQATKPQLPGTVISGLGKLEIPKSELVGGESASVDVGEKGQSRGPNESDEDSASDAQSSDLEFVEAQEPASQNLESPPALEQVNREQQNRDQAQISTDQNPIQSQASASPGKSSPRAAFSEPGSSQKEAWNQSASMVAVKLQTNAPIATQPSFDLGLDRALGGRTERSPPKQLQLCRKRSSSSPCNKASAARRSKSPTKSPKPVIRDPSPATPPSDGPRLAVKIIRTNDVELIEVAYEEYKLLRSIFHDNIVKMHDAFYNQMKCTMYLVMDMVQGQSLTQMLEERQDRGGYDNERLCESLKKPKVAKFTEQECKGIFMQLLDVIEYLSSEDIGVCHRDINPNNIMLDIVPEAEGEEASHPEAGTSGKLQQQCSDFKDNSKTEGKMAVDAVDGPHNISKVDPQEPGISLNDQKVLFGNERSGQATCRNFKLTLIDFNVAKRFVDPDSGNPLLMMTNTGTARYQAPEMLGGWMSPYDQRVDLWSAGAVLYYLLTGGIHAFSAPLQKDIEAAIREAGYDTSLPQYKEISSSAKDLIRGLITVDVAKRLTVHEAKQHRWLLEE